ncbi:endoplasmic reticulum-Golgi intermediate compartment protein 3 [Ischnura elegans]|uniref:endoplasmic reticulum-Golgi intermediate compartment protein 3 n=1 Tax=Ischnura elegans TaxID=197161 RepID=UPI001ED874E2|nr:endoplasmic reticulum-Golgi intermediate compartment protein 3 [Ischnura elegans]
MATNNIVEIFRRLDAYPKTLEDRIKTFGGALVTVISGIIMGLLFISELNDYFTPNISEEIFVDTSRGPKLRINLDIIVPTISCSFLGLDAMDTSGEQHFQIEHNIFKRRLDLEGKPIEEPKKTEELGATATTLFEKAVKNLTEENKCGSCYGAETEEIKCCNTCEDVREAYRKKRWSLPPDIGTIEQCKMEKNSEKVEKAFKEGCQIYGYMEVNRVGGSFHIAPGQSFSINHVHVHDVQPFSSSSFNTTHRIRHLSFGRNIPGKTNPIDGVEGIALEGATMFQYYVKIVPTTYVRKDGAILQTNQFSVTRHQKVVSIVSGESGMPGVFFSYELSPMMVKYTEKEKSLGHFVTNLCAIIGGLWTVAGIVDSFLYRSIKAIEKKIELGKFH